MFQTQFVEKIEILFKFNNLFTRKSCRLLRDIVKKYGTVAQVTDDNIIRRMRFERRITKDTDTLTYLLTYLLHGAESFLSS